MHRSMRHPASIPLLLALAAVAGCGKDGPTGPSAADLAGTYTLTQLNTTVGGVTTDQVQAGASMTLTLNADGTTGGALFVPAGGENGADLSANLAGTFTVDGQTVEFQQEADTFVRDMTFTFDGDGLSGTATFNDVAIDIVLTRE